MAARDKTEIWTLQNESPKKVQIKNIMILNPYNKKWTFGLYSRARARVSHHSKPLVKNFSYAYAGAGLLSPKVQLLYNYSNIPNSCILDLQWTYNRLLDLLICKTSRPPGHCGLRFQGIIPPVWAGIRDDNPRNVINTLFFHDIPTFP